MPCLSYMHLFPVLHFSSVSMNWEIRRTQVLTMLWREHLGLANSFVQALFWYQSSLFLVEEGQKGAPLPLF